MYIKNRGRLRFRVFTSIHKRYIIKILSVCHELSRKSEALNPKSETISNVRNLNFQNKRRRQNNTACLSFSAQMEMFLQFGT